MITMCAAPTRAEAVDIANQIIVRFDELPGVSDMRKAPDPGAPMIHEAWGDNVF